MYNDSVVAHNESVGRRDKGSPLQRFSKRFADLIESGNSIVYSLFEIELEDEDLGVKRVVRSVRTDVELGAQLSDAMAKHDHFFDSTYIDQVRAGEQSDLRVAFRRLATI